MSAPTSANSSRTSAPDALGPSAPASAASPGSAGGAGGARRPVRPRGSKASVNYNDELSDLEGEAGEDVYASVPSTKRGAGAGGAGPLR